MKEQKFLVLLVLLAFVVSGLASAVDAKSLQQTIPLRADAVVLVNASSAEYADFQHYVQPYLDNLGIPYTVRF